MELTIAQVAKGLGLPISTVERWIRQGRIPAQRHGGRYLFDRLDIEKWARRHSLPFSRVEEKRQPQTPPTPDGLVAAIEKGGVYYNVAGAEVSDVLRETLQCASILSSDQRQRLHQRLMEREALTSTGIGKGIALPHPRAPLPDGPDDPVIITAFLESPIDYGAVDDLPVFLLFLLLSPTVPSHLHLLSRLAFCIRDDALVAFLKTAPPAPELLSRLAKMEQQLEAPKQ